jgi:ferredoxin-NADP reductase
MFRPVVVSELRLESPQVISVCLSSIDGTELAPWEPGAHIDLKLPNSAVRQYSLVEAASNMSWYRIAVLRDNVSRGGSEYIHYFLRPGQTVEIDGPRNHFHMPPAGALTFVAGGIGIAPILPMIEKADRTGRSWHLHYASRSRDAMAFQRHLEGHGERVSLWPTEERGLMPLSTIVSRLANDESLLCCGPESMLSALGQCVVDSGMDLRRYHVERFKPRPKPAVVDHDVLVHARRSQVSTTVDPNTSLLDGLSRAGVRVSSSCKAGICGTCEVRILAGTPDHRDDVLTADQQAAGDVMMPCVSRAIGKEITLDV